MKRKLFTFLLAIVASIGLIRAEIYSGTCGAEGDGSNLTWALNTEDSTLVISGTGTMDYWGVHHSSSYYAPWHDYANNIAHVIISEGVTSIGSEPFMGCDIISVTVPNSVTSIGFAAFSSGCGKMKSITIPNPNTFFSDYALADVLNVVYSGSNLSKNSWGPKAVNGYVDDIFVYSDATKTILLGCLCAAEGHIDIPSSVESIGECAFQSCRHISSIIIPTGITSIEYKTFRYCEEITSVTIPNSVTSIGEAAFQYCENLTSLSIPSSVTSIGDYAFEGIFNINYTGNAEGSPWRAEHINLHEDGWLLYEDTAMSHLLKCSAAAVGEVIIPNGVENIGHKAFANLNNITSIIIPNSVTSIENYAFYNCKITSVTIPNSVTSIGRSVFEDCSDLISVTIPNSVTSIGEDAFYNCSSLNSVTIPNSVTNIGFCAFGGCTKLGKLYALSSTPPAIFYNTFSSIPSDAIVYVPNQSLSAYQSASYWQNMNLSAISGSEVLAAPTSVSIAAIQNLWALDDNYIVSVGVEGGDTYAGNIMEFTGLDPETEYTKTIVLTSNTSETETLNVSFTTTALQLTTQQPKIVSSSMAILLAETNMADAEVNCGFEWRRDNQPEGMASTKVYAPVANGVMAGRLKGLKDDVYYKYRAFYESSAGNKYYGDWQYIFTGDQTVEFDPVMYTYPAQAVTETTAILRGYALAGSDDFTEQGFEYWVEKRVTPESAAGAPRRAYKSAIGEHMTVQASGISMKVTLTDLDEGSVYKYRSYAVVDGQTIYGSEETFTTRGEYLYTVTFVDYDGTILGTDKVQYGDAATAPEDPTREGYEFAGWDLDFSNVTDDLTITATYSIATSLSVSTATSSQAQKLLRNGQLFILRDGKTYTVHGQEVK